MTNRRKGSRLRQNILHYLLERERSSDSSIPALDEIAGALGVPKEDINDQIDILESQGAIKSNRTFKDAAPMLTGTGKAILEEMEEYGETIAGKEARKVERNNSSPAEQELQWDAFICHASEDKDTFVRSLANDLISHGARIWYDEFALRVGDSLRRSIDKGLAKSRYGIVVLSHAFFAKEWPQRELDGLVVRERNGQVVILPVWFNISVGEVAKYSLPLADRVAAKANEGTDKVIAQLLRILHPNLIKRDSMGNQDKKQQSAVEMQEITQSVESPTSGQPTPSTPLPTPTRTPVFTYSDKGLVNTPPFDMGTSPWKLEFSANWSGHFAVQLRSNSIDLVINQNVTAGEIYKTYIYGHMGSNLHFSIVAAPPDGLWTLSVIAVT